SFTVTVGDHTAPVVTVPGPISVAATSAATFVDFTATATDGVDGSLTPACDHGHLFGLGVATVTCSATDAHGNTGSASFTVTVSDLTPPHIAPVPSQTLEATGPTGAIATFATPAATDNVDTNV